jgi:hypothetical protein
MIHVVDSGKVDRMFEVSGSKAIFLEVGSTMNNRITVGATMAVVLFLGSALAANALKSGPQVGDMIPGPFNVLNCNGTSAGSSNCQI